MSARDWNDEYTNSDSTVPTRGMVPGSDEEREMLSAQASGDLYATVETRRRSVPELVKLIIVVLVIALLMGGGWYWFTYKRHISVVVDDKDVSVPASTTVSELLTKNNYFGVAHGDLLSITGQVLKKGAGSAPEVVLNGQIISDATAKTTKLQRGDELSLSAGGNYTEDHDVTRTPIEPGLQFNPGGTVQYVKVQGKPGYHEVWVGKLSHEKVDKGEVKKPVDTIIDSLNPNPEGDKMYIALTFTDGPDPSNTPAILDVLKQNGAHATFFDNGVLSKENPDIEKRAASEGNQVASHTWSNQDLVVMQGNPTAVAEEVSKGEEQTSKAAGYKKTNRMIRVPYGSYSKEVWQAIHKTTSSIVMWDVDTGDLSAIGAQTIANTVISRAHNGSIFVLHDNGGGAQVPQALSILIPHLKQQGYEFVTMKEMLAKDSRFPKNVAEALPME